MMKKVKALRGQWVKRGGQGLARAMVQGVAYAVVPVVAAWALASGAQASPLAAQQVLQQFNLVALGDANVNSHTDGRALVVGNLNGSGAVFAMHPNDMPASGYAGLTVLGASASNFSVQAGGATVLGNLNNGGVNNGPVVVQGNASNSSFNGSGGSWVGGSKSGVNSNSGSLSLLDAQAALATAQSTDFDSTLTTLSNQLAQLSSTGSYWDVSGNRVTFHAVAGSNGVAVFDLTAVDDSLLAKSEFMFDFSGATTVIINTDVNSASINANFLSFSGGASVGSQIGGKTLWNFHGATSLSLGTQFSGQVLATEALLTNSNNIEGAAFVDRIQQNGEIHLQVFSGNVDAALSLLPPPTSPVPEPASLWLLLPSVGLLALGRRQAGQAHASRGLPA
jgi:choice-of-anchor A domain-containing protein